MPFYSAEDLVWTRYLKNVVQNAKWDNTCTQAEVFGNVRVENGISFKYIFE